MLGRTCLYALWRLGGITDEVNMVTCWIRCVYMHQSINMNCENEIEVVNHASLAQFLVESGVSICTNAKYKLLRNLLATCELLDYVMILELCYEQY